MSLHGRQMWITFIGERDFGEGGVCVVAFGRYLRRRVQGHRPDDRLSLVIGPLVLHFVAIIDQLHMAAATIRSASS
jgi:hypothetical protein